MNKMMNKGMQVILILIASLVMVSCNSGIRKEKRVLVYTKNGEGYVHDNIENNVKAIEMLGDENGFFDFDAAITSKWRGELK